MAENVLWFRLKVGMFDGESFKKIKRAKIGGVSYRDKLTAVWVELLDLAAKSNSNGYLIDSNGIPYQSFSDIATMIDREDKEVELCMQFFLSEKMVETNNDVYCITNFMQYQNQEGLDKIREQNRIRQANYRERQKALAPSSVTQALSVTLRNGKVTEQELESEIDILKENHSLSECQKKSVPSGTAPQRFVKPTVEEIANYCAERGNNVDPQKFFYYHESNGWKVGRNSMKDWKAAVRTWERNGFDNEATKPAVQSTRGYDISKYKQLDDEED